MNNPKIFPLPDGYKRPGLERKSKPVRSEDYFNKRDVSEAESQFLQSLQGDGLYSLSLGLVRECLQRKKATNSDMFTLNLYATAAQATKALQFLAQQGEKKAGFFLAHLLRESVAELNDDVCAKATSNLGNSPYDATGSLDWPVLYSPNSTLVQDVDKIQEALNIGKGLSLYNIKGKGTKQKSLNFRSPSNFLASQLVVALDHNRRYLSNKSSRPDEKLPKWITDCGSLPLFCEATVPQWLEVGWEAIMETSGGHPEDLKDLKQYGKTRGTRSSKAKRRGDPSPQAVPNEIKNKLKQALYRIAPRPQK